MNGRNTALDFAIEQLRTSLVDSLKFKSRIAFLLIQRIFCMSYSHIRHNKIFTMEGKVIDFAFQFSNTVHVCFPINEILFPGGNVDLTYMLCIHVSIPDLGRTSFSQPLIFLASSFIASSCERENSQSKREREREKKKYIFHCLFHKD